MTSSEELYACVYAREFPAQALMRLRPDLRNQMCVVMEGEPPLQQVCSLTRRARAAGLARGMTQVEVETFDGVSVLKRSQREEATAKAVLLECAGGYSPRVEDRCERYTFACVLDIAGTKTLFGAPQTLAESLCARMNVFGISASVTVSANMHAAIALARGLRTGIVEVIPAGEEGAVLSPLPLTVLDMSAEQEMTFALWGIGTLGALAALPEKELIARMGQAAKGLQAQARGEHPHLLEPIEPGFELTERIELDSPVELLDALLFVLNVMLEQLVLRAAARVLALVSVRVTLTLEGGGTHVRAVRPALPSNDRQLWLKLLHLDLEAHAPAAAILAVQLDAEPGCSSKVQLGLFSPQTPEPSRLDVTLARIRAIVGEERVGRAVLRDTHEPDGFQMEPFHLTPAPSYTGNTAHPRAAMRWMRPPVRIVVTLQQERPAVFVYQERRYNVERAYGPWHAGGDWWTTARWGCEQWDLVARARDGAFLCCCVMCDARRIRWQMAALYD